jgi:hypothetical protein
MKDINAIISLTEEIRKVYLLLYDEINEPSTPDGADWELVKHYASRITDAADELYSEADED